MAHKYVELALEATLMTTRKPRDSRTPTLKALKFG